MSTELPDHVLNTLFEAKSIAILGASSDPYKLGGRPIRYLKNSGFAGKLFPVNPNNDEIQGFKAYRNVCDIPDEVEQAIIILPAKHCVQAFKDCAAKGIRMVQLFSSGFAEEGEEGLRLQQEVMSIAKTNGIRVLGPNCLGVVGVSNRFFATFSTALEALEPMPGGVSIATQSGAFGSCAYSIAIQRGIGLARIAATGNEADIDVALCIDFFATDPATKVICAALEGCRDGDLLRRALLKAADNHKPVIMMKVGTSSVGIAAAATHTGSLAGNDAVFDAVFAECGAWRAHSIEEMLDIAYCCTQLPAPHRPETAVVTVSGGIGILMADDCERTGLVLPELPESTKEKIHELLPFAPLANPLDTTAQVTVVKNGVTQVMEFILAATDWPIMLLYMAQSAAAPVKFEPMKQELFRLRRTYPDRCFVLVGPSDAGVVKELEAEGFVVLADPTRAVRAIGAYHQMLRLRTQTRPLPDDGKKSTEQTQSHSSTSQTQGSGKGDPKKNVSALPDVANEARAKAFLGQHGLPILAEVLCRSADEAVQTAADLGYPVVLKVVSDAITHKTEIGGVRLRLETPEAVRGAYEEIMANAAKHGFGDVVDGVLVSPMVGGGVETILGTLNDPIFGPMIMFGLGGISVELFRDVAFASAPLTRESAESLIQRVKGSALLRGWRGQAPMDVPALIDAMVALSEVAVEYRDEVASIDINPFFVRKQGAVCLDAVVCRR